MTTNNGGTKDVNTVWLIDKKGKHRYYEVTTALRLVTATEMEVDGTCKKCKKDVENHPHRQLPDGSYQMLCILEFIKLFRTHGTEFIEIVRNNNKPLDPPRQEPTVELPPHISGSLLFAGWYLKELKVDPAPGVKFMHNNLEWQIIRNSSGTNSWWAVAGEGK